MMLSAESLPKWSPSKVSTATSLWMKSNASCRMSAAVWSVNLPTSPRQRGSSEIWLQKLSPAITEPLKKVAHNGSASSWHLNLFSIKSYDDWLGWTGSCLINHVVVYSMYDRQSGSVAVTYGGDRNLVWTWRVDQRTGGSMLHGRQIGQHSISSYFIYIVSV